MSTTTAKIDESGRLVIPAECRKALGFKPGDKLVLVVEEDGLRIMTVKQALQRAQKLLGLPVKESLVDELLRERREEAARE